MARKIGAIPWALSLLFAVCVVGCGQGPVAIETHFCAAESPPCSHYVLKEISKAKVKIEVAVFTFTLDEIAEALVEAAERGVNVWVVYELGMEDTPLVAKLESGGVAVRADKNPDLMHHKFMVVDDATVLTGSFNWTYSADNFHDENLLIIHSPGVAWQYHEEFVRVWEAAEGS